MLLVFCAVFVSSGAGYAAIDKPDIDKKLAAIAAYKQGDGRGPLIAVEELIRKSQSNAEQRNYIERRLANLLESQTSTDCKLFICRQLWFIGTEESVSAIAKLLPDERTVDMACYAIGQNPSAAAGKALRDALEKTSPAVQVRIIDLLGDRRDAEAVEALGKLVYATLGRVSEAAITALGKIGGDQATQILAKVRATAKPEMQSVAAEAYLRCAEQLAAEGKADQALAIYKELSKAGEIPFIRSAAVKGLADVGGADAVALVMAALRDENRMVRTTARGCVRTMQGRGVTELFAAELARSSPDEQVLLIAALADRRDPAALRAITAAAKSSDIDVRKAALGAVGKLGDASEVALLALAAAKSPTSDERKIAVNSLAVLRGADVDDAIVKSMQKAKGDVRAQLIGVLLERNAATAVAPLLAEARSADSRVRRAAFKALARLASERDLPLLISLLTDIEGSTSRRDAERATAAVARKIADRSKQADGVLAALHDERRPAARCSLLRVLGGIANDKALETVTAALKEKDAQVRDTAVRTLVGWPDASAAGALLGIYRDTQNQAHRLLSLRGLVRGLAVGAEDRTAETAMEVYRQAMNLTRSGQEKKLVLSGLSNVAHPEALEMVCALLDDEAVRAEAEFAAVKIAARLADSHRSRAKAALQKVLAMTTNESVRKQARDVITLIESDRE